MDFETILSRLTLEEKIAFCTGADYWHTKAIPSLGVGAIMMADGPHGLRRQSDAGDMLGINAACAATCFPTAVTAGASWDPALYEEEGSAIGKEAAAAGVSVVLGPGCNIKRNPLGGRNFEYISEDPYHAGHMAAAFVRGVESVGVGASLKHFAVNNQEYKRQNGDSRIDERTLREIYLTPFEIAVKAGKPATVMCSYNKINGTHASDSRTLLTDILRTEWGFEGAVVTDWGALCDHVKAFAAGCDLNMPGGERYMEHAVKKAVLDGTLDEAAIDDCVRRILKLVERGSHIQSTPVSFDEHHALARRIAEAGAVLLKNEDGILPAKKEEIALFGAMAKTMRYQGSGSSHINPTRLVSLTDALPDVPFYALGDEEGSVTEEELATAREAAARTRVPVVAIGLPPSYESEAFDREHLRLPEGYNKLVEAIASVNPNTVVLLFGGGAMEIPWADAVKGILYMGLPGQAGGEAAANLLLGVANPSGKLTESWPLRYEDVISRETFGKKNTEYREGVFVGYRYYDTAGVPVRFPFGHGLSYTRFSYHDLTVEEGRVSLTVRNDGAYDGAEVVQLYVAAPTDGIFRPKRELKGFCKLFLAKGEEKRVAFSLDERTFAVYADGWRTPRGTYTLSLASSLCDVRLRATLTVDGEDVAVPPWQTDSFYGTRKGTPTREEWECLMGHPVPAVEEPKKGAFTMDNTVLEMMPYSFVMRILYKIGKRLVDQSYEGEGTASDPTYRMMLVSVMDCPIRAMVICGEGRLKEPVARGVLHMANGRFLRGLLTMCKRKL